MKKSILTVLATLLVFSCGISACGSDDKSKPTQPDIETPEKPDNGDDNKKPVEPVEKFGTVNIVETSGTNVYADITYGKVGTLVTLFVETRPNIAVKKVTVNDADTISIGGNKFAFNLVEGENKVKVTVEEKEPEVPEQEHTGYVTIKQNPNVTVRSGISSGKVGDEVILFVQTNEGYLVDTVTVNNVEAIKESDTIYTFKLVEGENVVRVTTTEKPVNPDPEIPVEPVEKTGTVKIVEDGGTQVFADVINGKVGTLVTLFVEPKPNLLIIKVTVNDQEAIALGRNKYSFKLVEGDNNVKVSVAVKPEDPTPAAYVTITENPNVTIRSGITSGNIGDEVILFIESNEGFLIDTVTVNNVPTTKETENVYSFKLVDGENVVKVTTKLNTVDPVPPITPTEKVGTVKIIEDGGTHVFADISTDKVGTLVTLYVDAQPNLEITKVSVNNISVTSLGGNKYSFKLVEGDNNVRVSVAVKPDNPIPEAYVKITENPNVTIRTGITSGNIGDSVILLIEPNEGFEINTVTVNGVAATKERESVYSFKLVAGENVVKVTTKLITIEPDKPTEKIGTVKIVEDGGTQVFANTLSGKVGTKVTLFIEPDPTMIVTKVTVNDQEVTSIGENKYTFMLVEGDNNVRVSVAVKPVDPTPEAYVTIVENPNITLRSGIKTGNIGDEVILLIQPNEGFEIDKVTVNGIDASKESETIYTFKLVAGENVVKVTTKLSSVTPDKPVDPSTITIADFDKAINSSRPTSTQTNIEYKIGQPYEVTLHHSSILNVEYGSVVKGEYVYSHETLNPIGSSEMISTHSGINYIKGNLVGELTGNGINWNASGEQQVSLLKISLQQGQSLFEGEPIITATSLEGHIKDSQLKAFGITQDITNLNIKLGVTADFSTVTSLVFEYDEKVSNDPLNPSAHVVITANYTYNPVTVTFPENM